MKKIMFIAVIGLISLMGVYAQDIPNSPSDVYVDQNTNILMLKKPVDNNYQQFTIKGVNWSPATKAPDKIWINFGLPCPPCGGGTNSIICPTSGSAYVEGGFFFDWKGRQPQGYEVLNRWLKDEITDRYATDIPLIKGLNANAVRLYSCNLGYSEDDGNDTYEIGKMLDQFYENGIMVIMTVVVSKDDWDSDKYIGNQEILKYLNRVERWKKHPAILMWVIGNEWNFNKFYESNLSLDAAAKIVNQLAKNIKAIDPHHPVCSILDDKTSDLSTILTNCPDIDLWGINIYRGNSFNSFFDQWKEQWQNLGLTEKPCFISEFGIDSFYTETCTVVDNPSGGPLQADNVIGRENQQRQADVDVSLWQEIKNNLSTISNDKLCLGGLLFEFNDELWKAGNYHVGLGGLVNYYTEPDSHSYDDYNDEGIILSENVDINQPVSEGIYTILNEEHCGLVTAERIPKEAYTKIKEAWKPLAPETPVVTDEGNYTFLSAYEHDSRSLTFWFTRPEGTQEFQFKITEGSIDGPAVGWTDWESVAGHIWYDSLYFPGLPLVDGRTYYCAIKAINETGEAIGYSNGITFFVDKTKPAGSIQITKVMPDTPCSSKAQLLLNAVDSIGSGETAASGMEKGQMKFSYDGSTWLNSQDYRTSLTLELMPGTETLYVKFKDAAGNWSDVYSAKIPYLPQPPVVRDEGKYVIKNSYGSVQLEFHWSIAQGDIIDEFQYKITEGSTGGTVISDWKSVGLSNWVIAGIPTVNGKTYYCSVKAINNGGEAIGYSDGITVDTTKPTANVQIVKITPVTPSSSKVDLLLNAVDSVSGMGEGAEMSFSYDYGRLWPTYPYSNSFTFTLKLPSSPGTKIVYAKFKDAAGNWSDVYSIILPYYPAAPDKTPPQITHTPVTSAPKYKDIVFTANVSDSGSGVENVTLYWSKKIILKFGKWQWTYWSITQKTPMVSQGNNTYKATLYSNQTGNNEIKYYIEAKDKAGNVKKTSTYTISRY